MEKAYKLLAIQEGISNRSAKDLIDRGVVYSGGKKVVMARALMSPKTKFRVEKIDKIEIIFQDKNIVAVNKPPFLKSEEIAKKLGFRLLHRLDKETSGVLLLVKDEEFLQKAILEFKEQRVLKEYLAWCEGRIVENIEINEPILTVKKANYAYSKISKKGKDAYSLVEPLIIEGKNSKVKVTIKSGRTHQIRVHLKSIAHPIIGDTFYGGKEAKRVMLHSNKIELLGYSFEAKEPDNFKL